MLLIYSSTSVLLTPPGFE